MLLNLFLASVTVGSAPLKILNMKEMVTQHSKIHLENLMAQKQKHLETADPSQRKLVRKSKNPAKKLTACSLRHLGWACTWHSERKLCAPNQRHRAAVLTGTDLFAYQEHFAKRILFMKFEIC